MCIGDVGLADLINILHIEEKKSELMSILIQGQFLEYSQYLLSLDFFFFLDLSVFNLYKLCPFFIEKKKT